MIRATIFNRFTASMSAWFWFVQVLNCKIGKLQGELMAVCQMETGTDAVRCVREMYGLPYKNKLLDVKYMVGSIMTHCTHFYDVFTHAQLLLNSYRSCF